MQLCCSISNLAINCKRRERTELSEARIALAQQAEELFNRGAMRKLHLHPGLTERLTEGSEK